MAIVQISCPSCKQKGKIEISDDSFKNVTRGLLAINVPANTICNHPFIVYVDKNLSVRDYFIADFQIKIPEMAPIEDNESKKIQSKDLLNMDAIKLNLSAILITFVLKSIFYKKKIVIISDLSFLYEHFHNFFNQITHGSFNADISIISNNEYRNNKKNYKEHIIFEGNKIIRDKEKLINPKKLKLEKQMVSNFFMETDSTISYIGLNNEIRKIFALSKSIADFASKFREDLTIDSDLIIDHLEKEFNFKIHKSYLDYLLEVVKINFGVKNIRTIGIKDYLKYSTTGFKPKL